MPLSSREQNTIVGVCVLSRTKSQPAEKLNDRITTIIKPTVGSFPRRYPGAVEALVYHLSNGQARKTGGRPSEKDTLTGPSAPDNGLRYPSRAEMTVVAAGRYM